jgi:mannosyltransferase
MKNVRTLWPVAALVLLAFGLRVFWLDHQSLWFDEGWSWYVATRTWRALGEILRQVDSHPPLYYALLKTWLALAGQSDFSLRFLSVMAGTLAIPVVYVLGRRLLGRESMALAAALCLVVSPPHIVYSQEVRMYAWVVTLTGLSVYGMLRWLSRPGLRPLAVYVLVTAAALYTNYFAALVVLFENAAVFAVMLAGLLKNRRSKESEKAIPGQRLRLTGGSWLAAQGVLLLSLLALAPLLQGVLGRNFIWRPFLSVPAMMTDAWRTLTVGAVLPTWQAEVSGPVVIGLAGLGALALGFEKRGWARAVAAVLYLAIPMGSLAGLGLWRPVYTGRYLLPCLLPVALLTGAGLDGVWRLVWTLFLRLKFPRWGAWGAGVLAAGSAAAIGLGLPFGVALRAYYFDPAYAREDWRTIAAHIQGQELPGQSIVLLNSAYPFLHYYQGQLPYVILPADLDHLHDEASTAAALDQLIRAPGRVWWVGWQWEIADPYNLVESQLREHGSEDGELSWWVPGPSSPIRVAAYHVQAGGFKPLPRQPLNVSFGDGAMRLTGYHLQGRAKPGQRVTLLLWWELESLPPARWHVFIHLLTGPDLSSVVAQADKAPLNDHYPFSVWPRGSPVQDLYALDVPRDAPAALQLAVGVYDPETGERLTVVQAGQPAGDRLFLPLANPK